jgi:hypothetical protein
VYSYLFRDELLPVAGLEQVGPEELRMLREAAIFMALNKVRDDGSIATSGRAGSSPPLREWCSI